MAPSSSLRHDTASFSRLVLRSDGFSRWTNARRESRAGQPSHVQRYRKGKLAREDLRRLMLDGGFIRGGFAADYSARIIPAQNEPLVRAIAAATGTDRHPKIDIELQSGAHSPWICSFEGTEHHSSLFTTPDPLTVGLATSESYLLYLINTHTHFINEVPLSTPAACAVSDFTNGSAYERTQVVFQTGTPLQVG